MLVNNVDNTNGVMCMRNSKKNMLVAMDFERILTASL